MKKLILKIVEFVVSPLYGKKKYQPFFGALYNISLRGMNFRNSDFRTNGENFLIDKIAQFYKSNSQINLTTFDIGANVGDYTQILQDTFCKKK